MMTAEMLGPLETLAQFGVAGLMGVLWIWERMHSRRREQQLTDAHRSLVERDQRLVMLCRLIRANTRALVEFERTQKRLADLLEGMNHETRHPDP